MSWIEAGGTEGPPTEFLALPALCHGDDPHWIPEEPDVVAAAFSARNPWFERGEARLFCVPDRARAVAFLDRDCRIDGEQVAFFGLWESVGDPRAEERVADAVVAWARDRGAARLFGPIAFSTFGDYRFRTAWTDDGMPFHGEPYNRPEASSALEALGFRVAARYVSMEFVLPAGGDEQLALERQGFRFEALTHERWLGLLSRLYRHVDQIFSANFAYSRPSEEVFRIACGPSFIRKTSPEHSVLVTAPDGEVAGFGLVYPHWGPLLVQGAGPARVPASRLDHAQHAADLARFAPRSPVFKTFGVLPGERRRGLMAAMVHAAIERIGSPRVAIGACMHEENGSAIWVGRHEVRARRAYVLLARDLS